MASTPPTTDKPQHSDPDPNGDLMLILGTTENETRIRVSSKVLCLASPVMAAMLQPNFAEGRDLAEKGSLELNLPEDDPEAMLWLCNALHFKQTLKAPDLSLVERLAGMCDKYDASQALNFYSEVLLSNIAKDVASGYKMLWISYAFGNHGSFWSTCRQMILDHSAEDIENIPIENENVVFPQPILEAIEERRDESLRKLLGDIESIILPQLQHKCPHAGMHDVNKSPCSHLSRIGHYYVELLRIGLWPMSEAPDDEEETIESVAKKVNQFRDYYNFNGSNKGETCGQPHSNLKKRLQTVVFDHRVGQEGLCLNCIRHGRFFSSECCRAAFAHLCDG